MSKQKTSEIVEQNQPNPKKSSGMGCGWILPLLILGPTIVNYIRQSTAGWLTDQQLMILVGGTAALLGMVAIMRQVNRTRDSSTFPQPRTPPTPTKAPSPQRQNHSNTSLPSSPRFEPIITGKVVLAGLIFAAIFTAISAALLMFLGVIP